MKLREDFQENSEFLKQLLDRYDEILVEEKKKKKKKFRSIKARYTPPSKREGSFILDGRKCRGDQILEKIYQYLNKLYRSPQQKQFHQSFLASILRIIYGKDYEKEKHRISMQYKFPSRKQQVLVCAPRRMGKTWSVAFLIVVISIFLSDEIIAVFSPGKRQSVALMNHTYNFFKKLNETDRVIKRNEETIVTRTVDGRECVINGYPSAVKTLKGVSGTIVILEEMAVIDPRVLFEVVVPLHQIDKTSIIGISTITDEHNFMTKYLEKKDKNGELLFAVHRIYLACQSCRENGKAASCSHQSYLLPMWSSPRKRKIINCMMEDQEDLLNREIGGIANSLHEKAFPYQFVKALEEKKPYYAKSTHYFPHIFISIDPNGCGDKSDFAITSMIIENGQYIIVGLESFHSKTAEDNHHAVLKHLYALEQKPMFRHSLKVFIIERNFGLEAEHMATMLRRRGVQNYLVMNEQFGDDAKVGFWTSHSMKAQAVERVREKLFEGSLHLIDDCQLTTVMSHSKKVVKELLFEQMKNFSIVLKENEIDKPQKKLSGKLAGKDDLVITLMLNIYWCKYLYTKYPSYVKV